METTKVLSVTDGDTFEGSGGVIFRLEGVDTPERGQRGYEAAKTELHSLIYGKTVSVHVVTRDVYGRYVAQVKLGTKNINRHMKLKYG